jgi:hypothetical protein
LPPGRIVIDGWQPLIAHRTQNDCVQRRNAAPYQGDKAKASAAVEGPAPGIRSMLVNWSFISQLEGGRRLIGYVPSAEAGESGVTVATAIDLGHYPPAAIDAMAISDELKAKLKLYAGLKGEAAVAALSAHPLGLTSAEAEALDDAARKPIVQQVIASYNAAIRDKGAHEPFEMLPEAAQTVIASLALQYGPHLPTRMPHFWQCVCVQDWPGSVAELEQLGDVHHARHKHEAELLRSIYR